MKCGISIAPFLALLLSISPADWLGPCGRSIEAREMELDDPKDKSSLWMHHKLVASQKILEGMTKADYALIEKSAQGMQVMDFLEGWVRADRPGYKDQLRAFDQANGAIARAARDKNLDGVTLGYLQLTISCAQCHKLIRDRSAR